MKIIWDEPKRQANLAKHGMDFASLTEAFFEMSVVLDGKKKRYRAIGINDGGVICVIFARYGSEGVSVISMRPASDHERDFYAEYLET